MIYIQKSRSFFTYQFAGDQIWKISINDLEFKPWMINVKLDQEYSEILREALKGRAIIVIRSSSKITLVEIEEDGSKGKTVMSDILVEQLDQVEVGGDDGNILIALDSDNKKLVLCKINEKFSVEETDRFDLASVINNESSAVALSPCAKYCYVQTWNSMDKSTKQFMMSLSQSGIELLAMFDLTSERLNYFGYSFDYLKTIGDKLIFKCVNWDIPHLSGIITVVYNTRTKEFKELKKHRKSVGENCSYKLIRQGDTLYALGDNSTLLTLT